MLKVLVMKELKRVFSDRRIVFSAFVLPAVSIYILYSLMGTMMGDMISDTREHISEVAIYNAPSSFVDFYGEGLDGLEMNVSYMTDKLDENKEAIKSGDLDLIVVFDERFDEKVYDYEQAAILPDVITYYNPIESYSQTAYSKFEYQVLSVYEDKLLTERFGNLNYAKAFSVNITNSEPELFDEAKASGFGLSMIFPMLIAILLFAGAMGIGLDTIAGEKERGTMATLLLTPVSRETIAMGKVIGLAIVAIISASCSFIAIIASLPNSGAVFSGGNDINIGTLAFTPVHYGQLLVIMLTLVGIYVGLICITSVRAKSVKEAGTYVSPIYMLVMFAAFSTMFTTGDPALYQFAIPILGSVLAIKRLLLFELGIYEFLLASGVSIVVTAILIFGITRSFNNEKVMLNA